MARSALFRVDRSGSRWCWILPLAFVLNELFIGVRSVDVLGWLSYEPIGFAPFIVGVPVGVPVLVALCVLQAVRPTGFGWLLVASFVLLVVLRWLFDVLAYSLRFLEGPSFADAAVSFVAIGALVLYASGRPRVIDKLIRKGLPASDA